MKLSKALRFAPLVFALTAVAHAHPGHDGHELVWDFRGGHVHLDWMVWALLGTLAVAAFYRYKKGQN